MMTEPFGSLGVVPIFVNAGTALAPLIVGPLAAIGGAIMRPRLMLAAFRRRPWLPLVIVAVGAGLWFGIAHLFGGTPAAAASTRKTAESGSTVSVKKEDWYAKAIELLQAEREAAKLTGLKSAWTYVPDEGAMVWSTPAYDPRSNRVYCTATIQDVGAFIGMVYCVDAGTGRRIWQVEQAGGKSLKPFFSSPAVSADGKSVVIGQGLHADADCALLCFDADSGNLRWQVKTPLHIESSPAIRGDLAVVGAGAIEDANHKPTTDPGYVFAVQVSTGKQLWKHPVNDPESSPAFDAEGNVYIGSGFNGNAVVALRSEPDEVLVAKNLRRELWKAPARYPMTGPITVDGDLVLAGGGKSDFVYADPDPAGVVMVIDRKTGAVRKEMLLDESVLNRMAVRDGRVYCPVRSGNVVALSLADGKPAWRQPVSGKSPVVAGVALSEDGQTLFAASFDATLAVMKAADGAVVQTPDPDKSAGKKMLDERHALNAPGKPASKGSYSSPIVAGSRVIVGSETGGLRCFTIIGAK